MPLEGKKMYEEILDKMQELLKDEIKNFGGDFGKLEQAVMAMMMSVALWYCRSAGLWKEHLPGWDDIVG